MVESAENSSLFINGQSGIIILASSVAEGECNVVINEKHVPIELTALNYINLKVHSIDITYEHRKRRNDWL